MSDDEQLDALKSWWKENGSSLLSGVAIVLIAWFGFGQFRDARENASVGASMLYEQIAGLAASTITTGASEDDLLAAQSLYSQLKSDHDSSIYTRYAALMMARFHVEQQQLEQAAAELQWMLDNPDIGFLREADEEIFIVARLRLGRIKLAQGDAQGALALIQAQPVPVEFTPGFGELEGDIQVALGNQDAARLAYQNALAAVLAMDGGNPALLQLKLQDLGVNPVGML